MEHVLQRLREANDLVQRAGPYVLLEVLLPGGTLFALALLVYRRREAMRRAGRDAPLLDVLLSWVEDALDLRVVAASGGSNERDGLEPLGFEAGR